MYSLDDCRWLIGPEASPHLEAVQLETASHGARDRDAMLRSLRRHLTAERCELVWEQTELRRRAREKFVLADRMFFARTLLEQATEERIARYKGARFPDSALVTDLCCGLGGDALGLAARGPVRAIDLDPMATLLATVNVRLAVGKEIQTETLDVRTVTLGPGEFWHLDPDRRPDGRRTVASECFEPPLETVAAFRAASPQGALKLAPATLLPDAWQTAAELEWIGSRRECRQQVAWFGQLAKEVGRRRATVVQGDGSSCSLVGDVEPVPEPCQSVGRYLHEPHAAVLAAHLEGTWANRAGVLPVAAEIAYFTSDAALASPLAASFEVLEALSMDDRKLRAALRARRVGRLEIKVRGAPISPENLRRQLRLEGDEERTLLIAGPLRKMRAYLCRRILADSVPRRSC